MSRHGTSLEPQDPGDIRTNSYRKQSSPVMSSSLPWAIPSGAQPDSSLASAHLVSCGQAWLLAASQAAELAAQLLPQEHSFSLCLYLQSNKLLQVDPSMAVNSWQQTHSIRQIHPVRVFA